MDGFAPPAGLPSDATDTRTVLGEHPAVAPVHVSRRKTQKLLQMLVFGRMFVASLSNATYLPSLLIAESRLWKFTADPSKLTVIRVVVGVHVCCTPMQVSRS